jgi:hypothetical protein
VTASDVWPALTIEAASRDEVDCLLYAFGRADIACLVQSGFRVEVGGAKPEEILRVAAKCLGEQGIDSIRVVLRNGTEHVLPAPRYDANAGDRFGSRVAGI